MNTEPASEHLLERILRVAQLLLYINPSDPVETPSQPTDDPILPFEEGRKDVTSKDVTEKPRL